MGFQTDKINEKEKSKQNNSSGQSDAQGNVVINDQRKENNRIKQLKENSNSKSNKTGLPNQLKNGVENLSGVDISDTKVHYNSSEPAKIGAHAYTQGSDIHVASGQEKHLAHEAWHVVQQKQGRVKPTTNVNGVAVNDSNSLESEADVMGAQALQNQGETSLIQKKSVNSSVVQARKPKEAGQAQEEKKEEPESPAAEKKPDEKAHPLEKMKEAIKSSDYKAILKTKKDDPKAKEEMSMSDKLKAAMEEKKSEATSTANRASREMKDKAQKTAGTIKELMEKFKKKFSSGEKEVEKVEAKDKETDSPSKKLETAKTALNTTKTIISGIKTVADAMKTHSLAMKALSEVPGVGAVISGVELAVGAIEVYETYQEQKEQEIAIHQKYDGQKIMYGYDGNSPEQVEAKISSNMNRTDNPETKKTYMDKIMKIKEYVLDHELFTIAKKRFKRKVFEASTMFVAFMGKIAELFPGVGSLIGKILGGISTAMSAGAAAVRGIKQFGRDQGWSGFDASKNSSAKQNQRVSLTQTMLEKVEALPAHNEQTAQQYTNVENYFRKAGCEPETLYVHNGHTSEQIDYILESLKKR